MYTLNSLSENCKIPDEYDSRLTLYVYIDGSTVGLSRGMTVKHGSSAYFKCTNSETEHFEPYDTRFECMNGKWLEDATHKEWLNINYSYFPHCRQGEIM